MYIYAIQTLGSYFATKKNVLSTCNILHLPVSARIISKLGYHHTATQSNILEAFEDISHVFLDEISENMAALVQYGNFGAINTTYTTTMAYYVRGSTTLKKISKFSDWNHFSGIVLMGHIYNPLQNQHPNIFPWWCVIIINSRFFS